MHMVYLIWNDSWSVYEHNGYDMIFKGILSEHHWIFHVKDNWLSEEHMMQTMRGLKKEIPDVLSDAAENAKAICSLQIQGSLILSTDA